MRLIDADEFKSILDSQELMEHLSKVGQNNSQNLAFALAQVIDNRPTAYDVEKVVAELESLSNAEADYYYATSNDVIDRENAIDIVKRGGVECIK